MKKILRLTETDLTRLVKKILNEGMSVNIDFDTWVKEHKNMREVLYDVSVDDKAIVFNDPKQSATPFSLSINNVKCANPNVDKQGISFTDFTKKYKYPNMIRYSVKVFASSISSYTDVVGETDSQLYFLQLKPIKLIKDSVPFKNIQQGNKFRKWVNEKYPNLAKDFELWEYSNEYNSYYNEYITNAWQYRGGEVYPKSLGEKYIDWLNSTNQNDLIVDDKLPHTETIFIRINCLDAPNTTVLNNDSAKFSLDSFIDKHTYGDKLKDSGYYEVSVKDNALYFEQLPAFGGKRLTQDDLEVQSFYLYPTNNCSEIGSSFRDEKMIPNPYLNNNTENTISLSKYIESYKGKPSRIYSLNIYKDEWRKVTGGSQGYLVKYLQLKSKNGSQSIYIRTNCVEEYYLKNILYKKQLKQATTNLDDAMKYS